MPNPFYIPPRPGLIERYGPLVLDAMQLKQTGKLETERNRLMQEDVITRQRGNELEAEKQISMYGGKRTSGEVVEGLEPRKVSIQETQTKTEANKLEAEERDRPIQNQQFSIADSTLIRTGLQQQGLDKPLNRFLNVMDNMAKDNKFTKGTTYQYLKDHWPAYQQMIIEDLGKEIQKTTDPMQRQKLTQLMQEIGADTKGQILDMEMPATVRALRMEDEAKRKLPAEDIQKYQLAQAQGYEGGIIDFMRETQKETKPSSLSEKIQEIYNAYNGQISMDDAKKIATDTQRVVKDPFTGDWIMVDMGTKKQMPVGDMMEKQAGTPGTPGTPEIKDESPTLWELSDLSTGPVSGGLAALSKVTGMVGLPVAEQTERARQYIRAAQNDLIRSLSINPRFPVSEMERIKNEINIEPKLLDNPQLLRQRLIATKDYLERRLDKELRVSQDKRLPVDQRQAAMQAATDIISFVGIMGVPENMDQQGLSSEDEALINKYLEK